MRIARRLSVVGLLIAASLALAVSSASALSKHVFSTSFAGSGTNALSNPSDVDVDQSTGDVYVSDPEHHRIEKFTASGSFILMFGKEVDRTKVEAHAPETEQNVCTAASGDTCQEGTKGSSPGAFVAEFETVFSEVGSRLFLAVDNSGGPSAGDVYVADHGDSLVQKFDSEGNLIRSWGKEGQLDGAAEHEKKFAPNGLADGLQGIAVDPNGTLYVSGGTFELFEFEQDGTPTRRLFPDGPTQTIGVGIDEADSLYFANGDGVSKFSISNPKKGRQRVAIEGSGNPSGLRVDPAFNDLYVTRFTPVKHDGLVQHLSGACNPIPNPCAAVETFGEGHLREPHDVAIDDATGAAYVADTGNHRVAVFNAVPFLPDATASAEALSPTNAALEGKADPAGAGPISACHFQYVTAAAFEEEAFANLSSGGSVPCSEGQSLASETAVHAEPSGLTYGTEYHFRLLLENANGENASFDKTFESLPLAPGVEAESVSGISSDAVRVHAQVNPNGGGSTYHTTYHVEYIDQEGFEAGEFAAALQSKSTDAGLARTPQAATVQLSGLAADTTYHYRLVAENASGTTKGTARTFTTFPIATPTNDPCPNAHVRQQTGAVRLLDCRAYELVSAANTGGYDVESSLVAAQNPFPGFPDVEGRVLYGVHNGGIPGTDHPTNRGVDPYVAARGENGWSTEYVGVPANFPGAAGSAPFSSTPSGAAAGLETFAFGASGGCSPCFEDGSTGVPVRLPSGKLVQGMVGSETPGPSAKSEGLIAKDLSANGEHFVFGSKSKFEPDANEGELSIYDRNLKTEKTHVVSKTPSGQTMEEEGNEIAELAISKDGSHILIGHLVEEVEGNKYWHLYMNVGDSGETIDLMPGTTHGVLFDGMTEDGTKVFFSSAEHLTGEDTSHTGADIFMWSQKGEGEGHPLTLISRGNGNSCDPVANSVHEHWNVAGSQENCGAVAVGGGGGVSSANGTIYFLSPEKLAGSGNGTENAPNLYVAGPGDGYAPHFVATLESALTAPHPAKLKHVFDHNFGSFGHATALAVDHSSRDLYVLDAGANRIEKFDSSGNPVSFNFPAGSKEAPGNKLTGADTPAESFEASFFGLFFPTELAVDQSTGDLYVPDLAHGVVDKFSSSGEYLSQVEVGFPTAAAVDQATGELYVSSLFGSVFVFDSSGNPVRSFSAGGFLSSVAVDSSGTVYATQEVGFGTGETEIYDSSGKHKGTLDHNPGYSVNVDFSNGEVYVDEGEAIARFDSTGKRLETFGSKGELSGSVGVTIDPQGNLPDGNLYATNAGGAEVAVFLPHFASDPRVDNPLVVDSVSEPATRHTADFQVTPAAGYAAFGSTLALAGGEEETAGHSEVYRYTSQGGALRCVSCLSTGAASAADSTLAPDGLSLLEDGRVFFNSRDQLVNSDTDGRQDAYEFAEAGVGNCTAQSPAFRKSTGDCLALISAGTSPFDSGLLTATSNGKDAFFFTRDSLAPQDENGSTMKIYDAREGGGFPFSPQANTCQASDECHGAASPAPGPVEVGSVAGAPGNAQEEKCKKSFVRRHGVCARKPRPHKHKHRKRANHKRGGHK